MLPKTASESEETPKIDKGSGIVFARITVTDTLPHKKKAKSRRRARAREGRAASVCVLFSFAAEFLLQISS